MSQDNEAYLRAARELIAALERDDQEAVELRVDELTRIRETALFRELGALTRELHESLKSFRLDDRIAELTESEIPDARQRLNYVITITEQAAHRTLSAIETSMPVVDALGEQAQRLGEQWHRFRNRELSVEEFRTLSRDVEDFLERIGADIGTVQSNLTEALMAQDYQDLTGQVIRRVINLVQELEENLVRLIRLSGARMAEEKRRPADNNQEMALEGPHVPGTGKDEAQIVHGQDEVDDLLSSLGF